MNRAVTLGAICALAAAAGASTVYDNGPADFVSGNELTRWLQTEDFVLGAAASVNGATFSLMNTLTGNNNAQWDGTLEWFIFGTDGGIPDVIIASGNAQNVQISYVITNGSGWDFYDVAFDFGQSVALAGGTQYHFGLHMAADYNSRDELYWGTTAPNVTQRGWESEFGLLNNWVNNGQEHAFTLVPAPGAVALLALGGLAGARRRRR